MEGGLSWGGDETPPLLVLWGDWLLLRRSSSLKPLPEFCLKKPGLKVCGHKIRIKYILTVIEIRSGVTVNHYAWLVFPGTLVVSAPGEEGKDCWEH